MLCRPDVTSQAQQPLPMIAGGTDLSLDPSMAPWRVQGSGAREVHTVSPPSVVIHIVCRGSGGHAVGLCTAAWAFPFLSGPLRESCARRAVSRRGVCGSESRLPDAFLNGEDYRFIGVGAPSLEVA